MVGAAGFEPATPAV